MANRRATFSLEEFGRSDAPVATRIGEHLFSGPIFGAGPDGKLPASASDQAKAAFNNLDRLLERASFTSDDLVRVYAWLKNPSLRDVLVEPWLEMFPDYSHRPAANIVATDLPSDGLVALEFYAVKGDDGRRTFYVPGTEGQPFPSGAAKGSFFCSSALSGHYPRTGKLPDDPQDQADSIFANLQALLEEAGCHKDSVAHSFTWYSDHNHRNTNNRPFVRMFPVFGDRPGRHSLIRDLPEAEVMEFEVEAVIGARRVDYFIGGMAHGGIDGIMNSLPVGTRVGNVAFSSGTYGRGNTQTEYIENVFQNTAKFLKEAGMEMDDIGHAFVWYKEQEHLQGFDETWAKHFPDPTDQPALHKLRADLPGTLQIQLEVIAIA